MKKSEHTTTFHTSANKASSPTERNESIYIKTAETKSEWELTWPIWHMLPRDERKAIAIKHGMKTIGEFEEYMSLHKAEAVSAAMSVSNAGAVGTTGAAYSNSYLYGNQAENRQNDIEAISEKLRNSFNVDEEDRKLPAVLSDDDDDDGEEDDPQISISQSFSQLALSRNNDEIDEGFEEVLTTEELIEQGGAMLLLPAELLHKVLSFLVVDYYSLCALVHPTWASFTRTEQTYQIICQRLYLKQSKRKKLRVRKFQNSYWNMLMTRPRVRTGTGFYILKYRKVKKIQRDMWTEIPVGAVLESVYYRYLYFFEDGRVLYALSTSSPIEMVKRIRNMIVHDGKPSGDGVPHKDKQLVWGRYEVSKYEIQVRAKHSWCNVILDLKIITERDNLATKNQAHFIPRGKFCTMAMMRHRTSTVVDFDEYGFGDEKKEESNDEYMWWNGSSSSPYIVEHDVPSEYFRFVRDWRL